MTYHSCQNIKAKRGTSSPATYLLRRIYTVLLGASECHTLKYSVYGIRLRVCFALLVFLVQMFEKLRMAILHLRFFSSLGTIINSIEGPRKHPTNWAPQLLRPALFVKIPTRQPVNTKYRIRQRLPGTDG